MKLFTKILIALAGLFISYQVDAQNWLLVGNAGTATTNYVGTSDAKNLVFKTTATTRMTILATGNIGIGNAAPTQPLDVTGIIRSTGLIVTVGTPAAGNFITSTDAIGTVTWSSLLPFNKGGTGLATLGSTNQQLRVNAAGTALEYFTPTAGTVTSVGLAMPAIFTVTGSPVTTTGTLTAALASQATNLVFASPNGTTGAPTFRSLAAADIPVHDMSKVTTGNLALNRIGNISLPARLVGRFSTGAGTAEEITLGTGLSMSGTGVLSTTGGGTGTVTSVGLTMPAGFSVTGSPITSSGSFVVTTSLAGIIKGTGSGSSFVSAVSGTDFSAGTNALATGILKTTTTTGTLSIAVAGDFPVLNQNTTGTAANVTGIVAIANGGTGQTTANGALNALLPLQTGNATKVLQTDGTNAAWVAPSASPVTSVFGRTGVVVAAANDYTFAQLAAKPTTLAGYGITDAAALNHTHTFSTLTDFLITTPVNGQGLVYNGTKWVNQTLATGGTGTVTSVSVTTANGFSGTVATATTTPAISIGTSVSGLLKGNGTAISAATAGTDFSAGTSALATGILKSTTATGALSVAVAGDFPILNQNTTGTASNITGILNAGSHPALTGDVTTPSGSVATTIAANAVSFAKIQQIASGTLLGRSTAATGNVETITIGTGLSLIGGQLSATGGAGSGWNLNGNTVGVLKTLGTIDNFDLPVVTNNTEKMRLTAAGNLGIGTISPVLKLHVAGQDGSPALMISKPSSDGLGTVYTGIEFAYSGGGGKIARILAAEINAGGGNMEFQTPTGGTANAYTTKFFIARDGNVGVGITNPSAKLDVNGDFISRGRILAGTTNYYNTDPLQVSGNATIVGNIYGVSRISNNNYATYSYLDLPYYNSYGWTFFTPNAAATAGLKRFEVGNGADMVNSTFSNSNLLVSDGKVGVGTATPTEKLDVNGNIYTNGKILIGQANTAAVAPYALAVNGTAIFTKAIVKLNANWPDYVFQQDYKLPGLKELESYLVKNKHLPDMPSAAETMKNGIDLGDNQAQLLKKIEELTLYMIDLNKKVEALTNENEQLAKKVKSIKQ